MTLRNSPKKIGWGQVILLLLCCRSFTLMTFIPLLSEEYAVSTQMTAVLIAAALQLLMLIPLLFLYRRFPDSNTTQILTKKNSFLGFLLTVLFLLFFIAETADSIISFQTFLSDRFFKSSNPYIWLGLFLVVCVYCAILGLEGISRSSAAVFIILILMLIIMGITSFKSIEAVNFYPAADSNLFSAVKDELARNGEIAALCFLCKFVPKKFNRSVFGYIIGKIIIIEAVLLLIQGVLGDFSSLTDYPFLAVGAYAGVNFLQRTDAIYLVVWTMTAVLKNALFLGICSGLLEEVFPKMPCKTAIAAVAVYATSMPMIAAHTTLSVAYGDAPFLIVQILLVFVVPLLLIIFTKKPLQDVNVKQDKTND
ncbi:MAG: GerAB/ArcD/ProY family transporter [Ruminococcus sp.]|jgi:spore germination protein KB|nr:GerAB/ArcD/ProY family transporter [Ruminococcus sp.]